MTSLGPVQSRPAGTALTTICAVAQSSASASIRAVAAMMLPSRPFATQPVPSQRTPSPGAPTALSESR